MVFQFFGNNYFNIGSTVMIILFSVMLHITIEVPSSNLLGKYFFGT